MIACKKLENSIKAFEIYKQAAARYGYVLYNPNDKYIGRSLDLYGEYSQGEVEIFRQIIKPGWTILDIGANIGCHTVFMAQVTENSGRIIAFEPQRQTFQLLCANVILNSLFNVQCHNNAVSDSEGEILVPVLDPVSEQNFGGLDLRRQKQGEIIKKLLSIVWILLGVSLFNLTSKVWKSWLLQEPKKPSQNSGPSCMLKMTGKRTLKLLSA